MQNKELCLGVEAIANEKQISQQEVFTALEEALALACEKHTGFSIRININQDSGEFETFRRWLVVGDNTDFIDEDGETAFNIKRHIRRKDSGGKELGEFIEEASSEIELGRIAAQVVKQVIIQKVKESERNRIAKDYQSKIGQTVSVVVKRVDKGLVFVDLGGIDGFIPKSESIPNELVKKGDRIKVYVKEVNTTGRGVQIILSRNNNNLLKSLFEMEVPEISQGVIQIMGIARDPGLRAKIALRSRDKRIDAVGSAIGMRGSRIQAVSDSINGERIDVILWDDDIAQFVINALAPAKVVSIVVNEEKNIMEVVVKEDQLSQAIGKNGQNIRLTSELTNWRVNVISESESLAQKQNEQQSKQNALRQKLGIDSNLVQALIDQELDDLNTIMNTDDEVLINIDGFNKKIVATLKEHIQDELLAQALDNDKSLDVLLAIEGVDEALANSLIDEGILTQEDLAELSIDELLDIHQMDRALAADIILAARAPWFEVK